LKVFEYREGESLRYFEISSLWGRVLAYRAIRKIPGVKILKPLHHFALSNQDVFCQFQVGGEAFDIEEPWGDSSRFEVRASSPSPASSAALEAVMQCFRAYRPWPFSLVGG